MPAHASPVQMHLKLGARKETTFPYPTRKNTPFSRVPSIVFVRPFAFANTGDRMARGERAILSNEPRRDASNVTVYSNTPIYRLCSFPHVVLSLNRKFAFIRSSETLTSEYEPEYPRNLPSFYFSSSSPTLFPLFPLFPLFFRFAIK